MVQSTRYGNRKVFHFDFLEHLLKNNTCVGIPPLEFLNLLGVLFFSKSMLVCL